VAAQLAFETDMEVDRGEGEPSFTVDLDGFEGPLDLLLELARRQKVDLARISVLALAEQYLAFIEQARKVRLELAADYLVMAAWLAYLKSRLLLPEPPKPEGPGAAELAEALAQRLRRLEQIRHAAEALINRPRLGRDFFGRGSPEEMAATRRSAYSATLYDLLAAYAGRRQTQAMARVRVRERVVWSLEEARQAINRLIGVAMDWTQFDAWLIAYCVDPKMQRTARASSLSAALEFAREGMIELRQDRAFAPIWVRAKRAESEAPVEQGENKNG
jgi:segregation and condensation protein A